MPMFKHTLMALMASGALACLLRAGSYSVHSFTQEAMLRLREASISKRQAQTWLAGMAAFIVGLIYLA